MLTLDELNEWNLYAQSLPVYEELLIYNQCFHKAQIANSYLDELAHKYMEARNRFLKEAKEWYEKNVLPTIMKEHGDYIEMRSKDYNKV